MIEISCLEKCLSDVWPSYGVAPNHRHLKLKWIPIICICSCISLNVGLCILYLGLRSSINSLFTQNCHPRVSLYTSMDSEYYLRRECQLGMLSSWLGAGPFEQTNRTTEQKYLKFKNDMKK